MLTFFLTIFSLLNGIDWLCRFFGLFIGHLLVARSSFSRLLLFRLRLRGLCCFFLLGCARCLWCRQF
jgi:hypothetical protein